MSQFAADILAKRRDRAIAIILGVKERECDAHLPRESQAKLRKVVLDQLNDITEIAVDLIRSLDNGDVVMNDLYIERLDRLYDEMAGIRKVLEEA